MSKCNNSTISGINRDSWDAEIISKYLENGWIDDFAIALRLLQEANHKIYRLEAYKSYITKQLELLSKQAATGKGE